MEQTLELLGIKTDLLTSKPLFTRLETEEIFGCTHQTLKSFERRELIKPSRFKNKNFYSANEILSCIKKQIPQACKISKEEMEWNNIWGEQLIISDYIKIEYLYIVIDSNTTT